MIGGAREAHQRRNRATPALKWVVLIVCGVLLGVAVALVIGSRSNGPSTTSDVPPSASAVATVTLTPSAPGVDPAAIQEGMAALPGVLIVNGTSPTELKVYFTRHASNLDIVQFENRASTFTGVSHVSITYLHPAG